MKTLPTLDQLRTPKQGDNFAALLHLIIYAILGFLAIAITI